MELLGITNFAFEIYSSLSSNKLKVHSLIKLFPNRPPEIPNHEIPTGQVEKSRDPRGASEDRVILRGSTVATMAARCANWPLEN